MKKILMIIGTKEEFISSYPLIIEMIVQGYQPLIVNTGQQKLEIDQLLKDFDLTTSYNLDIEKKRKETVNVLHYLLTEFDTLMKRESPQFVIVHGETTISLAVMLAAIDNDVKVGHVDMVTNEHRLLGADVINQQDFGSLVDYYFVSSNNQVGNISATTGSADKIHVVGNCAVDMLKYTIRNGFNHQLLNWKPDKKIILIALQGTINQSDYSNLLNGLNALADAFGSQYKLIYINNNQVSINADVRQLLEGENLKIAEDLSFVEIHNLLRSTHLVVTDMARLELEATSLDIPVLAVKDSAQQPAGMAGSGVKPINSSYKTIIDQTAMLLEDHQLYRMMQNSEKQYADGNTAQRIIDVINNGLQPKPVRSFNYDYK